MFWRPKTLAEFSGEKITASYFWLISLRTGLKLHPKASYIVVHLCHKVAQAELTNKFIHFINLHNKREREREKMTQDWGPEDGLVPPIKSLLYYQGEF